jgi:hypothetical protein
MARASFESDSTASDATLDEKDSSTSYRGIEERNGNDRVSSSNARFRDSVEIMGQADEEEQVGLMQLDRGRQRVSAPWCPCGVGSGPY